MVRKVKLFESGQGRELKIDAIKPKAKKIEWNFQENKRGDGKHLIRPSFPNAKTFVISNA